MALTKPRIIELLLVTTVPTMFVAERGVPSVWLMVATVIGGTLAAGGANAVNMVVDRDIDGLMDSMSDSGSVKSELSGHTMKRYEIPGADSDLATIFETVEAKKGELGIVDFSVSQTSLEDVFIKFARLQS